MPSPHVNPNKATTQREIGCAEVRIMPDNPAYLPAIIDHIAGCDQCRSYMADRTCD